MTDESGVLTVLQEYWHMILGAIAFVVGYTRLHSKSEQNSRDNEATRRALKEMEARRDKQRAEDLTRIESLMGEVRADIKTLLGRH